MSEERSKVWEQIVIEKEMKKEHKEELAELIRQWHK